MLVQMQPHTVVGSACGCCCCRMHPHHQGSSSLQAQSCSLPVVIDPNPAGGFDYLATPSCQPYRALFAPDNEVIMHMQARSCCFLARNLQQHACPTPGPLAVHCACWYGLSGEAVIDHTTGVLSPFVIPDSLASLSGQCIAQPEAQLP
jgi:hypothetical protein